MCVTHRPGHSHHPTPDLGFVSPGGWGVCGVQLEGGGGRLQPALRCRSQQEESGQPGCLGPLSQPRSLVLGGLGAGERNFTPSRGRQLGCNQGLEGVHKGVWFIISPSGDRLRDPTYPPSRDGKLA